MRAGWVTRSARETSLRGRSAPEGCGVAWWYCRTQKRPGSEPERCEGCGVLG